MRAAIVALLLAAAWGDGEFHCNRTAPCLREVPRDVQILDEQEAMIPLGGRSLAGDDVYELPPGESEFFLRYHLGRILFGVPKRSFRREGESHVVVSRSGVAKAWRAACRRLNH